MDSENNFSGHNQNKPEAGSNVQLKKYVLLAENAKDNQTVVDIIKQAFESPSIYVFGELLDVAKVKALEGTEYEPYLKLLNLFAYGTFQEYKKLKNDSTENQSLPDLNEKMITKLRHLSVVTLGRSRRHVPYSILMKELDIDNIRQLEDLIIEIVYSNVIKGTMDQQNNRLEIDQTIARDVREDDFNTITNVLNEWCRSCDNILSNIEHQIKSANSYKEESIRAKQTLESNISSAKKNLKPTDNDDAIMTDANPVFVMREEKIKRGTLIRSAKNSGPSVGSIYKMANNKSWRRDN